MITLRKANERGHVNHGWLDSHHSFSFGSYYDPRHMGVGNLRVINEDRVAPGGGFPPHSHRDMEIVSVVLAGALEHKDSMGNASVIRPGEVQRMSAGTGVTHSEYNPSRQEPVHFLQIWLIPNRQGVAPGYEQKLFPPEERRGRWRLLVSPDGRDGSLSAHQDSLLYGTLLEAGETLGHAPAPGRTAYLHVARGEVTVNGETLRSGDAATLTREERVELVAIQEAEVLLFELA